MRLNYYSFPEDAPVSVMVANGCEGICPDGRTVNWWNGGSITDWTGLVVEDRTLGGISVTAAKDLLRCFGGTAWTEHIDRDGSCFEVSEIKLNGNNSKFKYNHHL